MEDFEREVKAAKAQQAKQLERNGGIRSDPASVDRIIDATKKLEEASTGDEAKAAKVMRLFMEDLSKDMAVLGAAQEALIKSTDYSSAKTPQDIDNLSKKARAYQKKNADVTAKIKSGWIQKIRENLEKEGVNEQFINNFIVGVKRGLNQKNSTLLIIRQTDDEICVAVLEQHAILKKYLNKWQWNATSETPDFEDDTALELYNAQAAKIQEISARQLEAQKKLLNVK